MTHYYGISPATLKSGGYSVWELAELVDELPDGCRYKKEVGGYWAWTDSEKLLVAQEYQLRLANWMNSKDGSKNRNRPAMMEPPKGRYEDERKATQKLEEFTPKLSNFELREKARQERLARAAKEDEERKATLQLEQAEPGGEADKGE